MPIAKRSNAVARRVQDVSVFQGESSKYRELFDQASDAILTLLPTGEVDDLNQAAEELTGFLKNELVGHSVGALLPVSGKTRIPERSRALDSQVFEAPGTYEDVALVRKDGYVRLVDISVRHVRSGERTISLALLRDLTERKRMERELITKHAELRNAYVQLERKTAEMAAMQETLVQAGKLAALGELAAGIAHELNQPLQGIRGYAQELQALVPNPEESVSLALREVISNSDKMSAIIGYLRSFVRKSVENHEFVDVHAVIEEALKMLKSQFATRGIEVHRQFDPSLPKIYANPLQLEQVFINLSTNARDAIEATGRGRGSVSIRTRQQGKCVEIEFRDDGVGMDSRTKSKAFNPFFTTKEVGKGMGLGLSLSYGMVSKLQGSMVVETELGKGTAFFVRLPVDYRELV